MKGCNSGYYCACNPKYSDYRHCLRTFNAVPLTWDSITWAGYCMECPSGSYCPGGIGIVGIGSSNGNDDNEPLIVGNQAKKIGCPAGRYGPNALGTSIGSCFACDAGKYEEHTGAVACYKECPAGTISSAGSSSVDACIPCRKGTYAAFNGSIVCVPCSIGTFSPEPGKTTCLPCHCGKYVDTLAATSCKQCPSGAVSSLGAAQCIPCTIGTFSPEPGQTTCLPCPRGKYADALSAVSCKKCPEGTVSSLGAAQCDAARLCPGGQWSSTGNTPCFSCNAGKTSYSTTGSTTCKPCPAGSITQSSGSVVCQQCKDGQYAPAGSFECTECPLDEVPTKERDGCETCVEGKYVSGGQCIKSTDLQSSPVTGILANEGTPFYIMAIIAVFSGALALMVYNTKKHMSGVLQLEDKEHFIQFFMNTVGLLSELILGIGILTSRLNHLYIFAGALLGARLIALYPGMVVVVAIISSKTGGGSTTQKSIMYYIEEGVIMNNSKTYLATLILAMCEPTILNFLPWHETEFSKLAKLPTMLFMVTCFGCKCLQLLVTLSAQVGIKIYKDTHHQDNDYVFDTIVIFNITLTSILAVVKGLDMIFRWRLMSGTIKNDDPHLAKETTQRTMGETQSGSENDIQSQKKDRSGLFTWLWDKGAEASTQDDEYTAEDKIPRPSVFELNTIYTGTELGDERLTQHTLTLLQEKPLITTFLCLTRIENTVLGTLPMIKRILM